MKKIAILGFEHGHINAIVKQWLAHEEYGVKPVCGWDHDAALGQKSCEGYGIPFIADLNEVLASDIDAVIITSETAYHAELAEAAAKAKKDIILYKPMAMNLAEADRIVNAVNENGVRLTMGWQMRTDPQNQKIRELIQTEELGKVCLYRRRHSLSVHKWDNFENAWHNDPKLNRDIFADDSAHPINMMLWIFGMPETVYCEMSTRVNPKIPNDNCVALFKYANGMIAEISCSFTCVGTEITTEVYCEDGSIQQYFGDAPATKYPRVKNMPGLKWVRHNDADWTDSGIASPAAHGERLGWQAKPMAEFLYGAEPVCSAEEGRDTLRCVLACYLSAREGARVRIDDKRIQEII